MIAPSVLTLVKDRATHLAQLVEGLRRSALAPAELIVVDMSAEPARLPHLPFSVTVLRWETDALPLAAARNRAAAHARSPNLIFLDVDCIPLRECLGLLCQRLDAEDALLCAETRYLGSGDRRATWNDAELIERAGRHPVREFPAKGVRREPDPGLFWSLAFGIRKAAFDRLGGFDESFTGYGAEDTDFGVRADRAGLPLLFVGGAIACHQYHASHEPPVQHLSDIVRNATLFRSKWGRWPMEGWLTRFAEMGLIAWTEDALETIRLPTANEIAATAV